MQVKNYILENEIGAGSFSTVYKAYNKDDGNMYAIKSMREMPRNVYFFIINRMKKLCKTKLIYSKKFSIEILSPM